ncbi:MAG: porin family protein [Bacteroidota bacterium]
MKNLKFLLVVAFAFFSLQTQAQVKFGVKAGLNMNNIAQSFKESSWESAAKMNLGFNFGLTADYELSEAMSIQTGLVYTSKGFKYDLEEEYDIQAGESIDGYDKVSFNYLEIPIHFAYKMDAFQIYAGPYVAFGIGGKNKWDFTYSDGTGEYKDADEFLFKPAFGDLSQEDIDSDDDFYSALDYGLNFGVGYTVGPILINAGYSLGLGNLTPGISADGYGDYDPKDFKLSNRVISVSVSYFFGE